MTGGIAYRLDQGISDRLAAINTQLPRLPSLIRYYDDFLSVVHTLKNLATDDVWIITHNGEPAKLYCDTLGPQWKAIPKHVLAYYLGTQSPAAAIRLGRWTASFGRCHPRVFHQMLCSAPAEFRIYWTTDVLRTLSRRDREQLKSLLAGTVPCEHFSLVPSMAGLHTDSSLRRFRRPLQNRSNRRMFCSPFLPSAPDRLP